MSFFGKLFDGFIAALARAIDGIAVTVRVAGPPILVSHREVHPTMPGTPLLSYTIQAPAFSDPSAVKLTFYATVGGVAQPRVDMQPGESKEVISNVPVGSAVDCWFTESDAAGNESVPGPHLTFTAKDDIPPAPPAGAPAIVAHVEVMSTTPTPDATPDTPQSPLVGPTPTPTPTPAG